MSYLQAITLGAVQGLTEFLPISSSAHLILVPWFLKWEHPGLAFDVAMHWGTLLGVMLYFRRDLVEMTQGFFGFFKDQKKFNNKLPWLVITGTVPAGIIGLSFEKQAETLFRSPWIISFTLITVAFLLYLSDKKKHQTGSPLESLNWVQAFLIGAAQGLAIVPGVSRSGITICAALFLSFSRPSAVRFSFLLSIPIILAAGILKGHYLLENLTNPIFLSGLAASMMSGYAAIAFLIRYVKNNSFTPFVAYRILLGLIIMSSLVSGQN